ncbi:hypothetical protein WMY93_020171 [Mugilogobius chulae]|uniref:Ig-like domain-containing protein n=1 Tax=Mugilogobius chulae TaxID=88201 RepID=A0AAW0NHM9_9GOBI
MAAGFGLVLVWILSLMQGVNGNPWNLTVPMRIMGIEGSCVSVPCSFNVPDPYIPALSNCSGGAYWRIGQLGATMKTAHVLGDLRQKNCTTVFENFTKNQNDFYFFRLDCPKSKLKYTFVQGVHITVTPGVTPPTLTSVTSVSHVTEGSQVRLHCSAMAPCILLPPSFIWTAPKSDRHEQTQILQTSDGQMMLKSTLAFTASAQHHNQTVTCSVSYPLSTGGSTKPFTNSHTLNVVYGPKNTAAHVSVSGPVPEGSFVNFTCSSQANPPVSAYAWFSNTNGTAVKVAEGQTLPLKVKQTHSGLYQCQAQSDRGTQRSKPLVLEVTTKDGTCPSIDVWLFIVSGVLSAFCILTVALLFHKYRSLSKRLKLVEQKGDNIYSDLQTSSISSDYDKLQIRQPKVKSLEEINYENTAALKQVFKQK